MNRDRVIAEHLLSLLNDESQKPVFFKITRGYVRQDYVDGKCVGQKFVSEGQQEAWEDECGNNSFGPKTYTPERLDMAPPDLRELVRDLSTALVSCNKVLLIILKLLEENNG